MLLPIREIKYVHEALNEIHYNTWLILDLDNTVMTPCLQLGGDAWFSGLFKHLAQNNIDSTTAFPVVMSVYNAVQQFIRTLAVESKTVKLIKTLQDIGVPVIGLTARGYSISSQTVRQLADIEIDFSRNSILPDNNFSYAKGIIFCDGKNKGELVQSFFALQKKLPDHVCMLDDKINNLEDVLLTLKGLSISFSGLRYAYLDEQVKQFSMEKATSQLAFLGKWLSSSVWESIKNLKLIPESKQEALCPADYANSFFYPDHPAYSRSISTPTAAMSLEKSKLARSPSALSFFYEPKHSATSALDQIGLKC